HFVGYFDGVLFRRPLVDRPEVTVHAGFRGFGALVVSFAGTRRLIRAALRRLRRAERGQLHARSRRGRRRRRRLGDGRIGDRDRVLARRRLPGVLARRGWRGILPRHDGGSVLGCDGWRNAGGLDRGAGGRVFYRA